MGILDVFKIKRPEPSPNAGKRGYDCMRAFCTKCDKLLMEVKIAVTGEEEKKIGLDEGMIEDLILRKIHEQCPFCRGKVVEPRTESVFVEESGATPKQATEAGP